MKKTNDKGFSLVELIIVIAIIAILAGALSPVLIKYIDNSKKSNDLSSAKTIKTAVETAMANDDICQMLTTGTATTVTDLDGETINTLAIIIISPSTATANTGTGISITPATGASYNANILNEAKSEIGKTIGEKTPKIEYRKAADDTNKPTDYYVYISQGGSVIVGVGSNSGFYQLCPTTSKYYK